jgi:hypothetical protein
MPGTDYIVHSAEITKPPLMHARQCALYVHSELRSLNYVLCTLRYALFPAAEFVTREGVPTLLGEDSYDNQCRDRVRPPPVQQGVGAQA